MLCNQSYTGVPQQLSNGMIRPLAATAFVKYVARRRIEVKECKGPETGNVAVSVYVVHGPECIAQPGVQYQQQ